MTTNNKSIDELVAEARRPRTMGEALACVRKAVSIETYQELAGPAPGLEHVRERFVLLEALLAELVALGGTERLPPDRRRTILTTLAPPWSRAALEWFRDQLRKWVSVPEELARVEKCLARAGGKDVEDPRFRAALSMEVELSAASREELARTPKWDPEKDEAPPATPITDLCNSVTSWAENIAREHVAAALLPEGISDILAGSYSVLEAVHRALSLAHILSIRRDHRDLAWVDCRYECALSELLLDDAVRSHPAVRHLARSRIEVERDNAFWHSVQTNLDNAIWEIEHVSGASTDTKGQLVWVQPGTREKCTACGGKGSMTCVRCSGGGSTVMSSSGPAGTVSWNSTCPICSGAGTSGCSSCRGAGVVEPKRAGEQCRKCRGTGKVDCESVYCHGRGSYWQGSFYVPCSMCSGSGSMRCDECRGAGHY